MVTISAATRKKGYILLLFFILLIVAGSALYWLMFRREYLPTKFFYLDESLSEKTGVLEKEQVFREPPAVNVTDFDPDESDPSLTQILQGYTGEYDAQVKTLQMFNQVGRASYLQQLEVSLDQAVGFYCWPKTVIGSSDPVETKSMKIMTYADGRDVYMPGEKFVKIELLNDFVSPDRYVIIQLFQPFVLGAKNLVQKLILVGC